MQFTEKATPTPKSNEIVIYEAPRSNANFYGREDYLNELSSILEGEYYCSVCPAVVGMAGIGKSQIAKRYAFLHQNQYDLIWWFNAAVDIKEQLKHFCQRWNENLDFWNKEIEETQKFKEIPLFTDAHALTNKVKDILRKMKNNWLIIFDNADSERSISEYIPQINSSIYKKHVITTSKNSLGWLKPLKLEVFKRRESIAFIMNTAILYSHDEHFDERDSLINKILLIIETEHTNYMKNFPSIECLRKIVEAISALQLDSLLAKLLQTNELALLLKDYPLALAQAASYIRAHPSINIEKYIVMFRNHRQKIWEAEKRLSKNTRLFLDDYKSSHYDESQDFSEDSVATVAVTLGLSLSRISEQSTIASYILNVCSFLNNNDIPEDILEDLLRVESYDLEELDDAISELSKYSILERNHKAASTHNFYSLHEMVQLVIQDRIKEEKNNYIAKILRLFVDRLDKRTDLLIQYILQNPYILEHAKEIVNHSTKLDYVPEGLIELEGSMLEFYLSGRFNCDVAADYAEKIQKLLEKGVVFGNTSSLALYHNNRSLLSHWRGNSDSAIKDAEHALLILKEHGYLNFQYVRILSNTAQYYLFQGDLTNATRYVDEARCLIQEEMPNYFKTFSFYAQARILMDQGCLRDADIAASSGIQASDNARKEEATNTIMSFLLHCIKLEILLKQSVERDTHEKLNILSRDASTFFQEDIDTENVHDISARIMILQAIAEKQMLKSDSAEKLVDKAIKSLEIRFKGSHKDRYQAFAYLTWGSICEGVKDYLRAQEKYKIAEEIYDAIFRKKEIDDVSILYSSMSINAVIIGDRSSYDTYLRKHIQHFGRDHPRTALILSNSGISSS